MAKNISPQQILKALPQHQNRGRSAEELISALDLTESQAERLRGYLNELVRGGLAAVKGGRYWRKRSTGLLTGALRRTRSGLAFVVPDDPSERDRGDLFVSESETSSAMHGDEVIARVTKLTSRGREGRVEIVLRQANLTLVGRFARLNKEGFVSPLDRRFIYDIRIDPLATAGARDGDIVDVEITRPPIAGHPPGGRVIEVLGQEGTPGLDLEILIRKHRLPHAFSDRALKEAADISDSITGDQLKARADLRAWPAVTIDGETSRDFDDAISLELLRNQRYRLGVHIADVSYYVWEETALDEEAFRRGTSVYFPERAIPMLPERLSNEICSLTPHQDRLAMSAIMDLDRTGRVADYTLTPSVIHSVKRMTYSEVNGILTNPEGEVARAYSDIRGMLLNMQELALILIKRRERKGAIDFDLPEAELRFNDEGQICGVVRSERNIAHRLIEEFMLLANETVASHLGGLGVPLLYRIHEEPNPARIEEFAELAESFGHTFSMHGPVSQRGFQHLLRQIRGLKEERMLSYLMLRSMERARYSPQNLGHFGLALKSYTHFTSPIRRYPDLIVHRILREVIEHGRRGDNGLGAVHLGRKHALKIVSWPVFEEERQSEVRRRLEPIAEQSSERERAADEAEHELMDWRRAEFMAARVGDEFNGIITSVKQYGLYVELTEFFVEGLVHVITLTDDLYQYEERKHRLVGTRTGRTFRLGDAVRVAVDRVDRARHLIDFSIA